jgi:phosphate transport system permease protein
MTIMAADPVLARRAEIQQIAEATDHRRRLLSSLALLACRGCLVITLIPLVALLAYVVIRGASAWNWAFFSHLPTPAGIPGGGIWNAIVGSLIIDGIAAAGAIPFGIAAGLFLAESNGRFAGTLRLATDVLAGVPSIVVAIFAYALLVAHGLHHFSAVAASFAIGILMLPVIMRASETAIRGVPSMLSEAGFALGARKATIARRVVLPAALPGLITGVLLAVARGAGETAPLLLTAVGSQYFSVSPTQPMAAIPLVIYGNGIQAYPDLVKIAWGSALFLVVVILVLGVGSRLLAARLRRVRRD